MPSDRDKIDRLDTAIIHILKKLPEKPTFQSLRWQWERATKILSNTRACVEAVEEMSVVFKRAFRTEHWWRIRILYRLAKLSRMAQLLADEIAGDIPVDRKDVFSVLKAVDDWYYWDEFGNRIIDIPSGYWPTDRFATDAEQVTISQWIHKDFDASRDYKYMLEDWRMRKQVDCPPGVRERLGARRV